MKYLSFLGLFFIGNIIFGQYTEVINSKRPGFSESPFGIGTKVYQIETGGFYQYNDKQELGTFKTSGGMDLFLRSGLLWEKFELNLDLRFQSDQILQDIASGDTFSQSGISQFTFGAKYLFYMPKYKDPNKEIRSWKRKWTFDKKRLIPSIGLYAGLNTNFLGTAYKMPSLSPKVVLLLQNDFSPYLIWVNNVIGDYLTLSDQRTFGYISTLSYSMTDRFSIFGETQGIFRKENNEFLFGGGFAYLPSKDMQIDIFARHEVEFDYLNLYTGLGFSWRLDRHKDKVIYKKTNNDVGSGKVNAKKGNFFQRIFKKKKKRRRSKRRRR
jgi:hypothetical protein